MSRRVYRVVFVCLLAVLAMGSSRLYGQGATTSTLSGTVVDSTGAVLPGADVVVKHTATGLTQSAVSNSDGAFLIPSLPIGTYQVTVSLSSFKTTIVKDVVLTSGAGADVKAVMELGGVAEQVTVSSSSEIVQTQSSTISSTINTNQITKLPLTSRSAMDFVNFLPGVSTPAGNRDATINGLPRGTINITLDGVNVQDNTLRTTDGFFAIVSPRLDAIEEVTVTTASQGAGDAGQGAVQIKFVTRSGTNNFSGSGYYYARRDRWNANTWFSNRDGVAKAKLKQDQEGFRVGGPIMLPGFNGRNKAFFFVNYEEFQQPSDTTRNRTILNPAAMAGNFTYTVSGVNQTVNVLDLAARNGQTSTQDPIVQKLMGDIRSAVSGGSLSAIDPNLERFTFNVPVQSKRRYPTFRLDYNVNTSNRASFAYNYQTFTDFPDTLNNRDPSFPGFPVSAGQSSKRLGWAGSVRSTLTRNLVNEARVGYSGAPVSFFSELNLGMYDGSVANQGGFQLNFPNVGQALTRPSAAAAPQSRNANSLLLENTLTWLKGSHSITSGASFTQYDIWARNSTLLPTITFGIVTGDPAAGLFTAANFPGASAANLTAAQSLYSLLTGRVSQIGADARLDEATGKYVYEGTSMQRGRLREGGVYIQDAWRLRQNFTINAGVRYDVQLPFYALNSLYSFADINQVCGVSGAASDSSCNLFQSGAMPGVHPTYTQYTKGARAYNVDYDNIAPSVGVAWTPERRSGLLGALMGRDGDFVIRGGYNRSFSRPGLNDFTGRLNSNPGITIDANRNASLANLGTAPLLLRETSRLGPPVVNNGSDTPQYPLKPSVTDSINTFDPHLQVPYADSWSAGIQRSLGRDMAFEIRYVGTRGRAGWQTLNYNEFNIIENGFLNEFRRAQANLAANIAAGRGATFAFSGAPGTAPLPVFLAFFNGQSAANAGNPALYSGTNWTNSTFLGYLAPLNPQPFNFASTDTGVNTGRPGLLGNATFRANAAAAGLTPNYFIANPETLGGANVVKNLSETKYNSLQLELRRRLSRGLQFQTSYVFGHGYQTQFETFRQSQFWVRDAQTPGDITHQFKANVVYDLPFGKGRRFGSGVNGVVDRVIGGWQLGLASKLQSGYLVNLGNVRLVGMTAKDVQNMFRLRFDDANKQVYMWPQDVIDNTILAFAVSATSPSGFAGAAPTGRYFAPPNGADCIEPDTGADYGNCGTRSLVVTSRTFQQHDIRISKRTPITGRVNVEFAAELLNAFNHPNFLPLAVINNNQTLGIGGSTISGFQLTNLTGTNTSRIIQLVSRINW